MSDLPEHAAVNRALWDGMADEWVATGERNWAREAPVWGQWAIPDSEVTMLPADMTGMRAIELGCGTAYIAAWMARRGATVTAVDNSERQLETAARLADRHGIDLELIHGQLLPEWIVAVPRVTVGWVKASTPASKLGRASSSAQ